MVGKIDNNPLGNARRVETPGRPAVAGIDNAVARSAQTGAVKGTDTLLSRALDVASQAPEVNQARVDAIKDAISRGEFRVDARAVANALLAMDS